MYYLIEEILRRERFKAAWLQSPLFFEDLEIIYSLSLITKTEWQEQLEVLYHPLLEKTELNKDRYEKNYQDFEAKFVEKLEVLMNLTDLLMDQRPCYISQIKGDNDYQPVVSYDKMLQFINKLSLKSKDLHHDSQGYQTSLYVNMSDASVQTCNTMANLFLCVERQLADILYAFPVGEFPIQCLFIKEMPEFDHSLKNMDRLGGTLEHLEKECKTQFAYFKAKTKIKLLPHQTKMLNFVKLIL